MKYDLPIAHILWLILVWTVLLYRTEGEVGLIDAIIQYLTSQAPV